MPPLTPFLRVYLASDLHFDVPASECAALDALFEVRKTGWFFSVNAFTSSAPVRFRVEEVVAYELMTEEVIQLLQQNAPPEEPWRG